MLLVLCSDLVRGHVNRLKASVEDLLHSGLRCIPAETAAKVLHGLKSSLAPGMTIPFHTMLSEVQHGSTLQVNTSHLHHPLGART